jgi:site-specific DNA recombinase
MQTGIYCRISQDSEGEGLGVARQEADCRAEAAKRGWSVAEVYVDNDISATTGKKRPGYQRMLRDIANGSIDALVVWDIDRLTRTPRELEDVIELANRHGLALANVGGEVNLSTSDGRMMARIKGTLARREVEQMSTRLKRKFLEKAEKGEPHGYPPYGYERVRQTGLAGRDVVHPEHGEVVQEAAHRILALESLRAVVSDFNTRGIHGPKAKLWNSTILRQILIRPTNAGLRQHQGRIIGPSTTEPLFDLATHHKLLALLTDPSRRSNHVGPGYKYLLSGLAICGLCGGAMRRQVGRAVTSKRTGATKRQPPSYCCSVCFKVRRHQIAVDDLVTQVVVGRLTLPDAVGLFATGDSDAARSAQDELDSITAKLAVITDQYGHDVIDGAQFTRLTKTLRERRKRTERELDGARPRSSLTGLVGGDVQAKWGALPLDAQRDVIAALMTVTVMPAGSGTRFNANSVRIVWAS